MALYCCCYRYYCLVSMLLILSSTQVTCSTEGWPVVDKKGGGGGGDGVLVESSMIGSRPPRCERRCISCGHCEAVQVPVVPPQLKHFTSSTVNSRSDDRYSNYKPMNWKCKCGDRILNP